MRFFARLGGLFGPSVGQLLTRSKKIAGPLSSAPFGKVAGPNGPAHGQKQRDFFGPDHADAFCREGEGVVSTTPHLLRRRHPPWSRPPPRLYSQSAPRGSTTPGPLDRTHPPWFQRPPSLTIEGTPLVSTTSRPLEPAHPPEATTPGALDREDDAWSQVPSRETAARLGRPTRCRRARRRRAGEASRAGRGRRPG
jgi:hypothetical protein